MDLFRSAKFAARAEALIERRHVPGIAIAIVHNDETASLAFGKASFKPQRPMTADTIFDIASASKSLTAASVALLVDDDEAHPEVKYEARMSELLPDDFAMPGKDHEGVTVDDVLGHRTGLSSNDNSYLGINAEYPDDARSVTRNVRNLYIGAPIRSKYMYCNIMYTVATYLVEKKTGASFSEFLHQRFFEPLGMTSSYLQPQEARDKGLGDRISLGHYWDKKKEEYISFDYEQTPEDQGAGSVMTSVNDYIKYVKAIMNRDAPFTKDVYEGVTRGRTITEESPDKLYPFTSPIMYAAGWEVYYYRGYQIISHDGSISGSATMHLFMPALKFGCVLFSNAEGGHRVISVLMHELIDEVLELPQDQRLDWEKTNLEIWPDDESDEKDAEDKEEQRQILCPGIKESQPQKMPLSAYTGEYWNVGFHGMKLQVRDGQLFIDGSDRSFPCSFTLEHVCEQTKYLAYFRSPTDPGLNVPLRTEFRFVENVAVSMGIDLEEDLGKYVWFDRVHEQDAKDC